MRTIKRHSGEAFCIAEGITIVVKDVRGNQPRMDVRAPRDMDAHREGTRRRTQADAAEALKDEWAGRHKKPAGHPTGAPPCQCR